MFWGDTMATVPVEISAQQAVRLGFRSAEHMQRIADQMFRERTIKQAAVAAILEDEDMIFSERMSRLMVLCGVPLKEQELRDAIQRYLDGVVFDLIQGHTVSYDAAYTAINQIASEHGFLSGVPIPVLGEHPPDLVMASGVPLAEVFHMQQEHRRHQRETEMAEELTMSRVRVRNSWHVLGDKTVCVVESTEGPMAFPRYDAGNRLRKLIRGGEVRHHAHQTAAAEFKALESLRTRVSESQFDSYVLSGMFPERSPRSDIWYFFRKGYPTLAVTFHGKHEGNGKVLAALCLHPMGYYAGTHVGLMTPTDEVIAHLLMMRADEHKFWAKSGQWAAEDTRSGI